MPTKVEDEWSDSDSDYDPDGDIETAVQLGIPDGPVSSLSDLRDPCVSRIGGRPAFFPHNIPDIKCSMCKNCSGLMPLALQIWCPLEGSPMDRTLYIWACSKGSCQKKDGSVRTWRGLRLNEKYAAKLARKAARQKESEAHKAPVAVSSPAAKPNPFSLSAGPAPDAFGLGSQIFGGAPDPTAQEKIDEEDSNETSSSEDDEDVLVDALETTTLDDSSPWISVPAHPVQYLSSIAEYLPPPPKTKQVHVDDPLADGDKKNKGAQSFLEAYENSLNLDEVFSRFTKRVEHEGQQCIRYELGGTPLPYASDTVFERLFPIPKSSAVTVTGSTFGPAGPKRAFSLDSIPVCQQCQSPRVFECQLMPNLINAVRPTAAATKAVSDEERRKQVEKELKSKDGMEWGTCMIFSCEGDCTETGWAEEHVAVQWE